MPCCCHCTCSPATPAPPRGSKLYFVRAMDVQAGDWLDTRPPCSYDVHDPGLHRIVADAEPLGPETLVASLRVYTLHREGAASINMRGCKEVSVWRTAAPRPDDLQRALRAAEAKLAAVREALGS